MRDVSPYQTGRESLVCFSRFKLEIPSEISVTPPLLGSHNCKGGSIMDLGLTTAVVVGKVSNYTMEFSYRYLTEVEMLSTLVFQVILTDPTDQDFSDDIGRR